MRPIKRESLHDQITSKLGLAILSGELKEGEISSEIVLCKGLGVSRTILRESLKVLVSKGLLNLRPKVGVSIRPRRDWNLFDPDVLAWQAGAVVDKEFIRTLCEVRLIVETAGAALAAVRGTPEEKAAISSCFANMESNLSSKEAYDEADIAFHGAIASAILRGDDSAARVAMENVILHAARLICDVTDTLGQVQHIDTSALASTRSMLRQVLDVLGRHAAQNAGTEQRASQTAPAPPQQEPVGPRA